MYKIFDEKGLVVFPTYNIEMPIRNSDTRVCMFLSEHKEIQIPMFNPELDVIVGSETLKTVSFLYAFEDIETDRGVLIVYSQFKNETKCKFISGRKKVFPNFVDIANKILNRGNFELIYFGERNEG